MQCGLSGRCIVNQGWMSSKSGARHHHQGVDAALLVSVITLLQKKPDLISSQSGWPRCCAPGYDAGRGAMMAVQAVNQFLTAARH